MPEATSNVEMAHRILERGHEHHHAILAHAGVMLVVCAHRLVTFSRI